MTDSRAAVGMDRLPWLADEPRPRARTGRRDLLGWGVAAVIVVAGASYWLGLNSGLAERDQPALPAQSRETTVPLPAPRAAEPEPPAMIEPPAEQRAPQVEPVRAPPLPKASPPPPRRAERIARTEPRAEPAKVDPSPDTAAAKTAATPKVDPLRPWPVRVTEGASGRLVQIGTFRTARQAKKGWWAMMKVNPALKRLPALVVPVQSLRDGQTYYRLQMGTTSQAHSQVLCQRMRMIGQNCVVIDERRTAGAAS